MTVGGSSTSISSAALCNVYVSVQSWNELVINDLLLSTVLKLASPLQVTIHYNATAVLKMEIGIKPNTITLYQRNSILRALCGTALHNTLDRIPYYLLGGYSEIVSSKHCTSVNACTNMSLVQYWMSIACASNNSSSTNDDCKVLFSKLNTVLTQSSYLTNTALPTIADMDITIMILSKLLQYDNNTIDEHSNTITVPVLISFYPSVVRWLNQTIATIVSYSTNTSVSSFSKLDTTILLPNYVQQYQTAISTKSKSKSTIPIFYNGTEDISTILNSLHKTNSASAASSAGKNNSKVTTPALKKETKGDNNKDSKPQETQQQQPTSSEPAQPQEKGKANKKEKKKAASTTADANVQVPVIDNNIPIEYTISAIDIRVGRIIKVWEHPDSEKLFCEEIDMGNGEIRNVASGIRQFYTCEQLLNQYVLVVYNLKSRNLAGFPSHGMVLCASNDDHTIVQLIVPEITTTSTSTTIQLGERIVFNGYSGDAENESKVGKKKIFEKVSPYLHTSDTGYVMWKDNTAIATTETSNIKIHAKEFLSKSKVS